MPDVTRRGLFRRLGQVAVVAPVAAVVSDAEAAPADDMVEIEFSQTLGPTVKASIPRSSFTMSATTGMSVSDPFWGHTQDDEDV